MNDEEKAKLEAVKQEITYRSRNGYHVISIKDAKLVLDALDERELTIKIYRETESSTAEIHRIFYELQDQFMESMKDTGEALLAWVRPDTPEEVIRKWKDQVARYESQAKPVKVNGRKEYTFCNAENL